MKAAAIILTGTLLLVHGWHLHGRRMVFAGRSRTINVTKAAIALAAAGAWIGATT